MGMQCRWEAFETRSPGLVEPSLRHHLLMTVFLTHLFEDIGRWAVWLGRHALEKISSAP